MQRQPNIFLLGWLAGKKTDDDDSQLPTIAIVASYNTFGAAPALSVGSDSNGSGVVPLLEAARLFSLLYSNPKTRGHYNLLFELTSGGPYNYNGTRKWLRNFDQRMRENIDYAIQRCIDRLASEEAENEKDASDHEARKASKKKKGISMQDLKDDRFAAMFMNKMLAKKGFW
ncbi:hypothetical protein K1719_043538 [Acacia pycnantha]|nr:hypothetical protein K1719_043538 [Acacia pycnantha]